MKFLVLWLVSNVPTKNPFKPRDRLPERVNFTLKKAEINCSCINILIKVKNDAKIKFKISGKSYRLKKGSQKQKGSVLCELQERID